MGCAAGEAIRVSEGDRQAGLGPERWQGRDRLPRELVYPAARTAQCAADSLSGLRTRHAREPRCGGCDAIAASVSAWLYSRGLLRVLAPVRAYVIQLWFYGHGFDWTLYPCSDGKTAFERPLSKSQWTALGETIRDV